MSTLFGHVRGSFTGALRDRPGLLRAADGGVLFLDEIGELGPDEQAALLRAIEEKQFLPLGADSEVQSDFQLIAGTNADLAARRARRGAFARICWRASTCGRSGCPASPNAPRTSSRISITSSTACSAVTGLRVSMSREARERFLTFATSPEAEWPGNFRDFNGAILRMATLAAGRTHHDRERRRGDRAAGRRLAREPRAASRRCRSTRC